MTRLAPVAAAVFLSLVSVAPASAQGFSFDWTPRNREQATAARVGLGIYGLVRELKGRRNSATVDQRGTGNGAAIGQSGSGHSGLIVQRGRDNSATLSQRGSNNAWGVFQFGRGNSRNVVQDGNGRVGITVQGNW